jgi:hypothetical protein
VYDPVVKGSVLSPFLYNLLGSDMDRFLPSGCDFLQYADDIVVYSSNHVLQTACALVQTACSSLSVFFFAALTDDILYKVEGGIVLSRSGLVADCCHKW